MSKTEKSNVVKELRNMQHAGSRHRLKLIPTFIEEVPRSGIHKAEKVVELCASP